MQGLDFNRHFVKKHWTETSLMQGLDIIFGEYSKLSGETSLMQGLDTYKNVDISAFL